MRVGIKFVHLKGIVISSGSSIEYHLKGLDDMSSFQTPSPAMLPIKVPQFRVKKDRHTSKIDIGDWSVSTTKKPILNVKEIEA